MKFPSRGGFSVRSILTFVFTALLTALLVTISLGPATHAQNPNSNWKGETIIFDNRQYYPAGTAEGGESHGLPAGTQYYVAVEETGERPLTRKAHVIYFAPGVSPPEAATATYVVYNYSSDKEFSNPSGRQTINITPEEESGSVGSSCSVSGIGWIICPVSVFLANSMDWLFEQVAQFVAVPPLTVNDTNTPLYTAWNIMRNIANIAFIIAFLIIIYSQLTNFGVTNYGIKKLLPRLIVAAVLVNISFYFCAIIVDASNILGYGFQEILIQIRQDTFALTDSSVTSGAWSAITAVALSGGAVTAGWIGLSTVSAGSAAASIYLIVPLLLGLILTLLFVLLILAARQAIIIILIVISPLAFVANLLPNTEKWFDKWKDLFTTMMIFFPAFSLVFGGSQLAGGIIIQNASNLVMMIFGLAVQVAPLVITPLLLKLSGGLLGRIAGIVNNPRKGLLDRAKNFSNDRAQMHRNKSLAQLKGEGRKIRGKDVSRANLLRRTAQRMDANSRSVADKTEAWKQKATNNYHDSDAYRDFHEEAHIIEQDKERISKKNEAHLAERATITGSRLNVSTIDLENAKVLAERTDAQRAHMISGYRAGAYNVESNEYLESAQRRMAENVIQTAAWKQGEEANRYVQQRKISERMRSDDGLLDIAQGYGDDITRGIGRDRAQANAVATLTKLNRDARENAITLIQTEAVEQGKSVPGYAVGEIFTKANSSDVNIRKTVSPTRLEAAMEIAAGEGLVTVFDDARASEYVDQAMVDAVVARHVGDMKAKGGFHIQAKPELSLQRYIEAFNKGERSESSIEEVKRAFEHDQSIARLSTLSNTNSANLGGVKFGAFAKIADQITKGDLLDNIELGADGRPKSVEDQAMVQRIFESLRDGLEDPSTRATMTDRLAFVRDMEETLRSRFFPDQEPLKLSVKERAIPGGGSRPESMEENVGELPKPDVDSTDQSPSDADNRQQ